MNNVLAFDTCTHACSVILKVGDELYSFHEIIPQQHAHQLLPIIQDLLARGSLALSDLDLLAVGLGPGAFTGVRIGVSAAQGLAFSTGVPVVGVSTLACLAQHAADKYSVDQVLVAVDARMDEVYCARYRRHASTGLMRLEGNEQVLPASQIEVPADGTWVGIGTGWDVYRDSLADLFKGRINTIYADVLPNAKALIALAEERYSVFGGTAPAALQPVYLRDQVAKPKGT